MHYNNPNLRNLFWNLPPIFQNAMATFYGYRLKKKVFSCAYEKYYKFLAKSQWLTTNELKKYQENQVIRLAKFAVNNVPYYKNLTAGIGISANNINNIEDLKKFPLLDKETVRNNSDKLIAEPYNVKIKTLINVHTSGTTGKGLNLKITREALQWDYAFRYLHFSWAGVYPGMRMAYFAGHPVVSPSKKKPPYWVVDQSSNSIFFSSQNISDGTLGDYISRLKRFNPDAIRGYPSAIYLIASGIVNKGEKGIRPKAVFPNSETLLIYQRDEIEKAFSCKIYDWYGNAELAGNIVECEIGNLHVKEEHSYVEFINSAGSSTKPDEIGEIVCTGFLNKAMPLIRYRTGDMAVPSNKKCPCGRSGQIVEKVIGRVEDFIITPEGRKIGRLDHLFKNMINVKEAQIEQNRIDEIIIRIVKRDNFSENDLKLLKREVYTRFSKKMNLKFEFVERLKRDSSGKLKFIVSELST